MSFNLVLLTALVLVESIQFLLVLVYGFTFLPPSSIYQGVTMPEWLDGLQPERELLLYRIFVLSAIAFQAAALWRFKDKLDDPAWGKALRRFLAVESLMLGLICFVVFKLLVYGHPWLKNIAWPSLIVVSILIKLFWSRARATGNDVMAFIHREHNGPFLRMAMDLASLSFIFAVIYLPDIAGVNARTFIGEQFHHMNTMIMAPAWGYSMGVVPNLDVNAQYGMGMPMLIATIAKFMGGVTYEHLTAALVGICIVYYWLCYVFLRLWFKSALLAAAGVILAIKWQMFHPGMYPCIFNIPNGLVVRYFPDILFFLLIHRHIHTQRPAALLAAAVCAGAAVFYVTDTGVYLAMTFHVYLLYLLAADIVLNRLGAVKSIWRAARYSVLTVLTAAGLFWMILGNFIFTAQFRSNMSEFVQFFLDGYEVLPMTKSLTDHQFLQGMMGFVIPAVYMLTLLTVTAMVFLRRIPAANILAAIFSMYGLLLHHYYVVRSASTQYYVMCLPYVFILCFWAYQALGFARGRLRRNILMGAVAAAMFALMTMHQFVVYPNMFNLSRNPLTDPYARPKLEGGKNYFHQLFTRIPEELKLPFNSMGEHDEQLKVEDDFKSDAELVDYYRRESVFKEDADLIAGLTPAGGRAAVMSGMEIQMLMQADRKPFFYYFPLLVERPMRMRNFPSTHLHTVARLQRTLKQLEEERPEYVFMERIFLIDKVSADFLFWSQDCVALVNYVRVHYDLYKQGKYMVAMKRKAGS